MAPALLPGNYSWVEHTTSEAAAQGVEGAWLARLGFLLFGFAVLLLAATLLRGASWLSRALITAFGVMMIAAAAFSHRSWQNEVPFDAFEDGLHSVAATALGFAFAFAVLARSFGRPRTQLGRRWLDAAAVISSVAIPIAMTAMPAIDGLLQRAMFLAAYVWFGVEAWLADQPESQTARGAT
jgi:hypothetical protein